MQLTIKQNTPNSIIRTLILDRNGTGGKTGLTAAAEGLKLTFIREGDASPTPVTLVHWEEGPPPPGAFREIDPQTMPGLYELALPNEVVAAGANRATLMIRSPEISIQVVHIDLVAYDPYDSYRLGLDCLSREGRHAVISRAFREVVPEIVAEFLRKSQMNTS